MGLSIKKIGSSIKKAASSLNKERKRAVSSVGKELERGVKNPDVWKAAALIAAPVALPAMFPAGAGTGFMSSIAKAGSYATSFLPGGAAAGTTTGTFLGNLGLTNLVAGPMGPPAPGQESSGGFFSGIFNKAKSYASDDLKAKLNDPNYMKGMLGRAVQHMAGSALAGDGLSDEEKRLMKQMAGDLSTLRSQDQQLFDEKLKVAREVIQEGRAIDTEQGGLKAQRDVQVAGGAGLREADRQAQMKEGGRGLTAGDRARLALDTTAKAQAAFQGGLQSAQDRRLAAISTGAGLLPSEAPSQAMYAGLNMAPQAATRREGRAKAVEGAGKMIESIVRDPKDVGDWDPEAAQAKANA